MKIDTVRRTFALLLCLLAGGATGAFAADHKPASSIPEASLVQPAELAAELRARKPMLILQVGFRKLYDQAHIAGAQYAGPGNEAEGLTALRATVAKLPRDSQVLIYCGCCPWSRCPNIAAAYDELKALKFTRVKVLYIADNFGADWVDHGYPVEAAGG